MHDAPIFGIGARLGKSTRQHQRCGDVRDDRLRNRRRVLHLERTDRLHGARVIEQQHAWRIADEAPHIITAQPRGDMLEVRQIELDLLERSAVARCKRGMQPA
jgi:hypothetical protein